MASNKAVVGLVSSIPQAEQVLVELERCGFSRNDVSVLLADKTGSRDFAHEKHTKAPEGATAGVGAGGAIGGTLGLLAGIGALAIPGLGPFIAAGPIMAALSGAAAGAAVGGVAGALIGMGIPELEAKQYEGKLKAGNILMSIHVEDGNERKRAKETLEKCGAKDVATAGEKGVPASSRRSDTANPRA